MKTYQVTFTMPSGKAFTLRTQYEPSVGALSVSASKLAFLIAKGWLKDESIIKDYQSLVCTLIQEKTAVASVLVDPDRNEKLELKHTKLTTLKSGRLSGMSFYLKPGSKVELNGLAPVEIDATLFAEAEAEVTMAHEEAEAAKAKALNQVKSKWAR